MTALESAITHEAGPGWAWFEQQFEEPQFQMSSCPYSNGAPPLNSDISGIGVRLSFYFQTLFLGIAIVFYNLHYRDTSIDDIWYLR